MDVKEMIKAISQNRAKIDQQLSRGDLERLIQFLALLSNKPEHITVMAPEVAGSMFTLLGTLAVEEYVRLYG